MSRASAVALSKGRDVENVSHKVLQAENSAQVPLVDEAQSIRFERLQSRGGLARRSVDRQVPS